MGNPPAQGGWGHNIRQPQYAAAPLLQWRLSKEQKYFDAASELMDYKTEFTIFETMHYDALHTILSRGGNWNRINPFEAK